MLPVNNSEIDTYIFAPLLQYLAEEEAAFWSRVIVLKPTVCVSAEKIRFELVGGGV